MSIEIIVAITAVFGPLRFITWTKLFDSQLKNVFESLAITAPLFRILDLFILWFSLGFQIYYWLFIH